MASTILEELAKAARGRVAEFEKEHSTEELRNAAFSFVSPLNDFAFETALSKPGLSFICECKKASPSKGLIAPFFPYLEIAREYERAGADCVSVLTEPTRFLGADEYLREVAAAVKIPCLRKDFTVDELMIYQAKLLGASAVLLICSILDGERLEKFFSISESLGLTSLVETHDEKEIKMALDCGARVIGVNNRNLKDFTVDLETSAKLRRLVGNKALFVAESGVKTPEDVDNLRQIGADAVLVGEVLMRAKNKAEALNTLRGAPL